MFLDTLTTPWNMPVLVSLAGIRGMPGKDLFLEQTAATVVPGDRSPIRNVNRLRKWLLIQATSAVGAYVWFQEQPTIQFELAQYDSLLINEMMPWTGTVSAASRDAVANCNLVIAEASVVQ